MGKLRRMLGLDRTERETVDGSQERRRRALEAQQRRIANVSERVDRILEIQTELVRREQK